MQMEVQHPQLPRQTTEISDKEKKTPDTNDGAMPAMTR